MTIQFAIFRSRRGEVLDLSCKNGHFTRLFARLCASQVIGYDPSETLIHLA